MNVNEETAPMKPLTIKNTNEMTQKKVSTALAGQMKRHKQICDIYTQKREQYESATQLYFDIAKKVCCSVATVIRVLKLNNLI